MTPRPRPDHAALCQIRGVVSLSACYNSWLDKRGERERKEGDKNTTYQVKFQIVSPFFQIGAFGGTEYHAFFKWSITLFSNDLFQPFFKR